MSASSGFSFFLLEHGRELRDIANRATDTSELPAPAVEVMQSAVDTDNQQGRAARPKQAGRTGIHRLAFCWVATVIIQGAWVP